MALVAVVSAAGTAAAERPSWCPKDYKGLGESEVNDALAPLDIGDPDRKLAYLAQTLCSSSSAVTAKKADLDARHEKIGKLFGLKDADWADALDLDQPGAPTPLDIPSDVPPGQYSSKDLAKITPVEQYMAISSRSAFQNAHQQPIGSPIYFADAFGSHLSELGRAAFLNWCFSGIGKTSDVTVTKQAICQEDFDRFDPAKAFDDIRAAQVSPNVKMAFRQVVAIVAASIPSVSPITESFIKKDDEYKRVLDVAAAARTDWEKTVGTRTALLDLALKSESAFLFGSRKMADGCEQATAKAVQDIVAKIPAKVFKGAHDTNEGQGRSFGEIAADVFITNKELYLAGLAYFGCRSDSGTGHFFQGVFAPIAGFRGPRTAAWTALAGETFKFDDTSKQGLSIPNVDDAKGLFDHYNGSPHTSGGVVKAIKPDGKNMEVDFEQATYQEEGCVQQHNGNHIMRVLSDGTVQYNIICDKYGMRTYAVGAYRTTVTKDSAKLLKPGLMFSSFVFNGAAEVIAIWPNKTAKLPSMVLGVPLK